MKTTLEIPDKVFRQAKAKAAEQALPKNKDAAGDVFQDKILRYLDYAVIEKVHASIEDSGAVEPFERRAVTWPVEALPVPADLLVYTESEWQALVERGGRFAAVLSRETVWVWTAAASE